MEINYDSSIHNEFYKNGQISEDKTINVRRILIYQKINFNKCSDAFTKVFSGVSWDDLTTDMTLIRRHKSDGWKKKKFFLKELNFLGY